MQGGTGNREVADMISRKRIADLLNKWCRNCPEDKLHYINESDIDIYLTNVTVDDKTYSVYMGGNDEMFEVNEFGGVFYQLGVTKDGKVYVFYFDPEDENGYDIPLEDIDYTKAYRVVDVTGHEDDYCSD